MNKNYASLIGIPYEKKDCWSLAVDFYRDILGIELKSYFDGPIPERSEVQALVFTNKGDFEQVKTPQFGDIIVIKLFGIQCHFAIYLGSGQILHTTRKTGSVVDRFSRWSAAMIGFYRVKKND